MTSIIKVNNLQNQCGANIISESSNTITIGASGDTVVLAAGASQSGFGRSGSVNWDTTPKTTGFTAVSGNGYFCDTTSAAFTVTLPATPAAGDIVAIADYANTSATNNITVGRNGVNIDGNAVDGTIRINGQVYTLVYVDATEGWKTVSQTYNQITTAEFVAATGGTILTCGDYKTHVFTGPGTFTVSSAGNAGGSNSVEYLVVAGGGGGSGNNGGGGGAGGYRQNYPSPITAGLPVTVTSYPITVGSGGNGGPASPVAPSGSGNPSIFSTITSTGGGNGAMGPNTPTNDLNTGGTGGSGGGSRGGTTATCGATANPGGAGNTPPTSPPQGNPGGKGLDGFVYNTQGGGGGGAGAAGGDVSPLTVGASPHSAGSGGVGSPIATAFFGPTSPSYGTPGPAPGRYFAGGGGGGTNSGGSNGSGGSGGGGGAGVAGTVNTGGGGGGNGNPPGSGAAGGSGIVIIRYKFQ